MPTVSIFKDISHTRNPEYVDIFDYFEKIRDGEWEIEVGVCRNKPTEEEQKAYKHTMPTTSLSGEFHYRDNNGLTKHNNYICIDIDRVQDILAVKRKFTEDKYVVAVWISSSGGGLHIVFSIDGKKHTESFRGLRAHIFDNYGLLIDPNGISVSKPYIVSFDSKIYINPYEPPVFKKYVIETPIKKLNNFAHTSNDFEAIIKQITGRHIDICENYEDWLKVGFAISEQFGEDGRASFHEVSRVSHKYNSKTCNDQYDQCLKGKGGSKVGISSFYYLAKINGISISSEQTKNIVRRTRSGIRAGLSKETIVSNLKKFDNIEGADELVGNIISSKNEDSEDDDESIVTTLETYISNGYTLQMNEVTGYLEQYGVALSPSALNTIFVSAKKIIPKLDYQLMIRLLKSDFIPSYNPFYKFLGSDGIPYELPAIAEKDERKWDSPLLDKLALTIENNNPVFTHFFLRKWMVSIISAMHKVHSPLLLCLLGGQGTGKTEFFRRLLPSELSGYYAESKLDKEKDDELLMTENIIVMDDELGGKSKQDAQKLKNITSKQYFSLRRPYGDHNEKILRLAVLCGTSNFNEVLSDQTGNRRIIPIEVHNIDKKLFNSIDKGDLLRECFRLYKEGFDWRVTYHDIPYLNANQVKYEIIVKERELIEKYYSIPKEGDISVRMTSTDIEVELFELTKMKLNGSVIGRQLENLGFKRTSSTRTPDNPSGSKKWHVMLESRSKAEPLIRKEDLPF